MTSNEQQEMLIARVAEGSASSADWDQLFAAGRADGSLWRRLAETQRDQAQLVALMTRVDAVAENVPLPEGATRNPASRSTDIVRGTVLGHWGGWRSWTGWAVAAALIAAWSISISLRGGRAVTPAVDRTPTPSVVHNTTPAPGVANVVPVTTQQAFQDYLDKGRADGTVLGVVPRRVILETRPNPAGSGVEMIYLQQIMERTVVPNLYQLEGRDEKGRPGLVRYEEPVKAEM